MTEKEEEKLIKAILNLLKNPTSIIDIMKEYDIEE
jgi:hypothetical protein